VGTGYTVSALNTTSDSIKKSFIKRIRFAYTTNNASDTISGYRIDKNGGLTLLEGDSVSAFTGQAPVDLTTSKNGKFLYALNAGSGTISMYRIKRSNGNLIPLGEIDGLPVEDGAVGITAR
jgi:6-phosphogluconolactonase (cycloisomerase 2 family)